MRVPASLRVRLQDVGLSHPWAAARLQVRSWQPLLQTQGYECMRCAAKVRHFRHRDNNGLQYVLSALSLNSTDREPTSEMTEETGPMLQDDMQAGSPEDKELL